MVISCPNCWGGGGWGGGKSKLKLHKKKQIQSNLELVSGSYSGCCKEKCQTSEYVGLQDNRYTCRIGLHDHIRCMQFKNLKCVTQEYILLIYSFQKANNYWILLDLFIFLSTKVKQILRRNGDQHFKSNCSINESISNVMYTFVTKTYCLCRNLNCRTIGCKYREKLLVTSKHCQTLNCRTIEVSDCQM